MSANRDVKTPIKYLTIDQMMLKIAAMRAAAREKETSAPPPPVQPGKQEAPQAGVVFPEYVSHCELWSKSGDVRRTRELKAPAGVDGLPVVQRAGQPVRRAEYRPGMKRLQAVPAVRGERPHYFLGSMGAIVGALVLALALAHLKTESPTLTMGVPAYGNMVAGGDPWNEISNDDVLSPTFAIETAPHHVRPKIAPEQLEANVHRMLASNGFPDVGVSASHRGEVYLAGEVFSAEESDAIVKIAKLAADGGRVFFLHPEVREPQGSTFFGAIPDHAPEIWGARVRSVVIGSPAYKAGIVVGDVIREFGHATVGGANDLEKAIADHKPGQRVTVRIWRGGSIKYSIARLTGLAEVASR